MSKYGSASALMLVDGYNLLSNKVQGLSYKITALTEPTHGMGDSWEETTPVGICRGEFKQEGAFFFSDDTYLFDAFSTTVAASPSETVRVVSMGLAGNTSGQQCVGFEGAYTNAFEVIGQTGKLTRANVEHVVSGAAENCLVLKSLGQVTGNSASSGTPLNNGSATTEGGSAYLHITELTLNGATNATVVVRDSSDGVTFGNLGSFVAATAISGQRIEFASTIKQYVSQTLTWDSTAGTPTATYFVSLSRI